MLNAPATLCVRVDGAFEGVCVCVCKGAWLSGYCVYVAKEAYIGGVVAATWFCENDRADSTYHYFSLRLQGSNPQMRRCAEGTIVGTTNDVMLLRMSQPGTHCRRIACFSTVRTPTTLMNVSIIQDGGDVRVVASRFSNMNSIKVDACYPLMK
jgi:hypothetical protein